jgi:hypothetical protein
MRYAAQNGSRLGNCLLLLMFRAWPTKMMSDTTTRERSRRNVFCLGADGATAPETLRQQDRVVRTIWRETPIASTEGDVFVSFGSLGPSSQVP